MTTAALITLAIYALVGPFAWLVMWTLMLFGRSRMGRLTQCGRLPLPIPTPHVSVLVPARDEGLGIDDCIHRLLALDYPNFNVIAIDDRSTDDTGRALDALAAVEALGANRLRVLHVTELRPGWLGKCHALNRGTREIDPKSEWLLFVDSDVTVEPRALADTLALATSRGYDAITILTRLECRSFLERLILPLAAATWMSTFTASLTNDDNLPRVALANGQFFLIRRAAYESVGGHESVRDQIVEDVELMLHLKMRGHRVRFLTGTHLATTRMHTNLPQMFHGWGRIFAGTARQKPARLLAAIGFIIVCGWSLYVALACGVYVALQAQNLLLLYLALAHGVLLTTFLAVFYRGSGNPIRHTLLFPASSVLVLGFLVLAVKLCFGGSVAWRGARIEMKSS